jgi:hypothetical protein
MKNTAVQALAANGSTIFAVTSSAGGFYSSNHGATWTAIDSGPGPGMTALMINGPNIFAGSNRNGISRSSDNGLSWTKGVSLQNITSFASSGTILVAGTYDNGVYRSLNNGDSWTLADTGLTNWTITSLTTSSAAVFAGTSGGIFRSTNSCTTWTAIDSGLTNLTITALLANGATVYAGSNGGGVFRSTDNGSHWTAFNSGLPSPYIHAFATNGAIVFAGSDYGISFCTTNGAAWLPFNTGLASSTTIQALTIIGDTLFAGVSDFGVWKCSITDILATANKSASAVLSRANTTPLECSPVRAGNFQAERIRFSVSQKSFVKLSIVDMAGRTVETLVSREFSPGTYGTFWNATAFLAGTYIVRLQTGSCAVAKKIILMK